MAVTTLPLPVQFLAAWIGTWIVPLGERHLRRTVSEFAAHYHQERNHQGLKNQLIETAPEPANTNGRIIRRERLGGLLNFYSRTAA